MAVTAQRNIVIQFSEDIEAADSFNAANNEASPGQIEVRTFAIGDTTVTPPGGGTTPVACTIIPPAGNTATLTLKGVAGDTGVVLHKTDPTSIGLNSPTVTFVLTASAEVAGCRLVWT